MVIPRLPPPPTRPSFFFNDTATTEIYTLSPHDALPICLHQMLVRHSQDIFHMLADDGECDIADGLGLGTVGNGVGRGDLHDLACAQRLAEPRPGPGVGAA